MIQADLVRYFDEVGVPESDRESVFVDLLIVTFNRIARQIKGLEGVDLENKTAEEIQKEITDKGLVPGGMFEEVFNSVLVDYKKAMMG